MMNLTDLRSSPKGAPRERLVIYKLPARFIWDHWSRDLPEAECVSVLVSETKSNVYAEIDATGYDELMSDARYYAEEMGSAGFGDRGLISSARATVKALESQGKEVPVVAVWSTGKPGWRCANCGRANIYHDPTTGSCPEESDDEPKVS